MLSKCNGDKKAVIIGIDYIGTRKALKEAMADAVFARFYIDTLDFPSQNIRTYTDDEEEPRNRRATRSNIMRAMSWLVDDAGRNDSLFFQFSGHGGRNSRDGSYICTSDNEKITQKELRKYLVDRVPSGCRMTAVFDCCHSGNILGLKYGYPSVSYLQDADPEVDRGADYTNADVICWSATSSHKSTKDNGEMNLAFVMGDDGTYLKVFKMIRRVTPNAQLFTSNRITNGKNKFIM